MGTSVATYHYMKKGFMKWKICIPAIFGAIAGPGWGLILHYSFQTEFSK